MKDVMTDEKLFQFLVARLQARETASLATATIAASASLVLLALYFQSPEKHFAIFLMGFVFPAVGIIYNEITNRGIHKADHLMIRRIIKDDSKSDRDTEAILTITKWRRWRLFFARFLFFTPIFGWSVMIPEVFDISENVNIIIGISWGIGIAIVLAIVFTDKITSMSKN